MALCDGHSQHREMEGPYEKLPFLKGGGSWWKLVEVGRSQWSSVEVSGSQWKAIPSRSRVVVVR